jgi:hypothetical protein
MALKVDIDRIRRKQQNEAVLAFNKRYLVSVTAMMLWAVHETYGFGKKRLRRLFKQIVKVNADLEKRYRYDAADDMDFIYQTLLKRDVGIDMDEWYNEDKTGWTESGEDRDKG